MIPKLEKASLFGMIFLELNFWAKGWSVPVLGIYMGYSWKVKGSSFPMVVVSGRTMLGMVRNEYLKMVIF
jgi:hypothetical protein